MSVHIYADHLIGRREFNAVFYLFYVKSQSRSLGDFSKRASTAMSAFFAATPPSPEQVEVIMALFSN